MEEGYDRVNNRCKLCKYSFEKKWTYNRHYKQCHDPHNSEKCDVEGCKYRFKTQISLRTHKTSYHNLPSMEETLPEEQRMVWVEEVKCVHDQGVVGVFVGVSNYYHAETAAKHRDNEGQKCIVSKHFESEELCKCDHSSARKLFTVSVKRKDNEADKQFKTRVIEVTNGYKMYARQHFVNSIFSNYSSNYELSEMRKERVRAKLQNSDFSQYYAEDLQQALTYHNWKKSVQGQEAVAAKKKMLGQPGKKRKVETVTSCEIMSPVKQKRVSEETPPNHVLKIILEFGRPAMREWCDKLSQEEKQSKSKVAIEA